MFRLMKQKFDLLVDLLPSGHSRTVTSDRRRIDHVAPGEKFLDGDLIACAGIVETEQSTTDRGQDFGLPALYPAHRRFGRQIVERQDRALGPDDVARASGSIAHQLLLPGALRSRDRRDRFFSSSRSRRSGTPTKSLV